MELIHLVAFKEATWQVRKNIILKMMKIGPELTLVLDSPTKQGLGSNGLLYHRKALWLWKMFKTKMTGLDATLGWDSPTKEDRGSDGLLYHLVRL